MSWADNIQEYDALSAPSMDLTLHCILRLTHRGAAPARAESAICFLLGVDRSKLHMAFSAQVIRVTRRQMRRRHPTPQTSSSNVSNRLFRVSAISPLNSSADVIGFLLD